MRRIDEAALRAAMEIADERAEELVAFSAVWRHIALASTFRPSDPERFDVVLEAQEMAVVLGRWDGLTSDAQSRLLEVARVLQLELQRAIDAENCGRS